METKILCHLPEQMQELRKYLSIRSWTYLSPQDDQQMDQMFLSVTVGLEVSRFPHLRPQDMVKGLPIVMNSK